MSQMNRQLSDSIHSDAASGAAQVIGASSSRTGVNKATHEASVAAAAKNSSTGNASDKDKSSSANENNSNTSHKNMIMLV